MFKVHDVILSEDIATSRFACNISLCKGACCVVGDAGAPVEDDEIKVLENAFKKLRSRLKSSAIDAVKQCGVVKTDLNGRHEITCAKDGACIFVEQGGDGVATCAIQNAFYRGDFNWEKPISCHLYPIRLKKVGENEYANFDYFPETCESGCSHGKSEGIYLTEFLEKPLRRRYGNRWYKDLIKACSELRSND